MASRGIGIPKLSQGSKRRAAGPQPSEPTTKKSPRQQMRDVWPELKEMIRPRRKILALGFVLMIVNRLSGLVLPLSTNYLMDNVIVQKQMALL